MSLIEYPSDRWIARASLVGACLSTACGGVIYGFSLYGPQLAAELEYSSVQINTIAIAGNMGMYASSPLFGYLSDVYRPCHVAKISSILYIMGFFGMMMTFDGTLPYDHFMMMAFYYFLVGAAGGCAYMNATSTTGHNFKNKRGFGIGLPVTFFGLSAFIFSFFNRAFFVNGEDHDTSGFLRFMGITASIVTFLASFFLIKINHGLSPGESIGCLEGLSAIEYGSVETADSPITDAAPTSVTAPSQTIVNPEVSGWNLFINTDAQLLFLILVIVAGSGLVYINNIGTIFHTLDALDPIDNLPHLQSLSVSLLSLASCSGRLLFAAASDHLENLPTPIRRISWLIFSTVVMGTIHLASAYASASSIAVYSAILGFGYGILFSVCPTLTSIWFGASKFGRNWGWINVAPAIGGQLLSLLFGAVYDAHLNRNDPTDDHICELGVQCYQLTFQIMALLCFVCTGLAYLLKRRRDA